jgi:hypothetical protein
MRRFVVLALAGCASGGDASGIGDVAPAQEPGAARSPAAAVADGRVAPAPAEPLAFVCRSDAFCEDFEGTDPASRWSGASQSGFAFVAPSASRGVRSMRVAAKAGAAPVYLLLDAGARGASFSGALSFAVRLDAVPAARIAGPSVVVGGATIGVELRPHGMVLVQQAVACTPPTCLARGDLVSDASAVAPGVWHRVVIGFEVNGADAPPYGRIEIGVDGADLVDASLTVPLFDGAAELHAGVTIADEAPFGFNLDDVMFFTKP